MKYILPLLIISLTNLQINCDNASKVIEYAKSKIGCGFVFGAKGEICSPGFLYRFTQNWSLDKNYAKKWIGTQVFDCAGLVSKAFQQVGIKMVTGATSAWKVTNWQSKGTISNYQKDKVCVLYKEESGRMQHTGIYIGNGEFIHASGSKIGVVKEKMPGKWTHWGIPKGLYASPSFDPIPIPIPIPILPGNQAKVIAPSGKNVNLRKNPSKNSAIVLKINLGETVTIIGRENDWYKVTYNSTTGYMMKEFLSRLEKN